MWQLVIVALLVGAGAPADAPSAPGSAAESAENAPAAEPGKAAPPAAAKEPDAKAPPQAAGQPGEAAEAAKDAAELPPPGLDWRQVADDILNSGAMGEMIRGGFFMWPILALGIMAAGVILERWRSLKMVATDTAALRNDVMELLQTDRVEEALQKCDALQGPVPAVLAVGLRKYLVLRRLNYDPGQVSDHVVLAGKRRPEDRVVVVRSRPEVPYHHWIAATSMIEEAGGIIAILREEEREVRIPQ